MKTKIEIMRDFFKENPESTQQQASESLGFTENTVKQYIWRDVKRGYCIKDEEGRVTYLNIEDELSLINEWKSEIRRELIEQLLSANRHETSSEQIRMNAKTINQILGEI